MRKTNTAEIKVTVAAPVAVVWEALRDPSAIRRWFGWEYDGLAEEIDVMFLENASASDDDHTVEVWGVTASPWRPAVTRPSCVSPGPRPVGRAGTASTRAG